MIILRLTLLLSSIGYYSDDPFFKFFQGGKEGKMPTVAEIFKETRQQKSGTLDAESASKLVC